MRRRNPEAGLVVFWVKLRQRGYSRSVTGLYRTKFVPSACLTGEAKGKRFYQYTAIDEFSRWRYVEAFEEHSTYSSMIFLVHLVQAFPMPIECVQTDNGTEFTKRFTKASLDEDLTLFERKLKELGIKHKKIRPFTPRHNGKVERSHRKDNERFYATHCFFSFEDFRIQLKRYNYRLKLRR